MTRIGSPLPSHRMALYREPAYAARLLADFVQEGAHAGEGTVVLARGRCLHALRELLEERGFDAVRAIATGWLVMADSELVLDDLLGGPLDAEALRDRVGPALDGVRAATGRHTVRVFGDLSDQLWRGGRPGAALQLEGACHDLLKVEAAHLLCVYCADALDPALDAVHLLPLCRAHGSVAASEDGSARQAAIRAAIERVLGHREQGHLELVASAAGLPQAEDGGDEVKLLWLRTQLPNMAHRIMTVASRVLGAAELADVG